jgi:hypothetical protein
MPGVSHKFRYGPHLGSREASFLRTREPRWGPYRVWAQTAQTHKSDWGPAKWRCTPCVGASLARHLVAAVLVPPPRGWRSGGHPGGEPSLGGRCSLIDPCPCPWRGSAIKPRRSGGRMGTASEIERYRVRSSETHERGPRSASSLVRGLFLHRVAGRGFEPL